MPTEVAILNKMVKVDLIRKVTFESGVQVVGHVITRGRVFQATGPASAHVLREERVWYVSASAKSSVSLEWRWVGGRAE